MYLTQQMQFKGISNQITIALKLILEISKFKSNGGCSSAVEKSLFNLHDVIHEYVILTSLICKIVIKYM